MNAYRSLYLFFTAIGNAITMGCDSIDIEYSPWYMAHLKMKEDCCSQMSQSLANPAHLSVGAMAGAEDDLAPSERSFSGLAGMCALRILFTKRYSRP